MLRRAYSPRPLRSSPDFLLTFCCPGFLVQRLSNGNLTYRPALPDPGEQMCSLFQESLSVSFSIDSTRPFNQARKLVYSTARFSQSW